MHGLFGGDFNLKGFLNLIMIAIVNAYQYFIIPFILHIVLRAAI